MKIQGKVVAKIQQEGGASFARIQVYRKKKTAAALMRIFDIVDDGELNVGDQVTVEVLRIMDPTPVSAQTNETL